MREKRRTPMQFNIDLGLSVIGAVSRGERWSQTDIAKVCGCKMQTIQQIEYRALQKLKRAARHLS